jgi:hypothetical protein
MDTKPKEWVWLIGLVILCVCGVIVFGRHLWIPQ